MQPLRVLAAVVAFVALAACGPGAAFVYAGQEGSPQEPASRPDTPGMGPSLSVHTLLGVPDDSTADASNTTRYLSVKPQYVISYNSKRKAPNWASWELTRAWLGTVPRSEDFRPDDTLPPSLPQPQSSDYSGSGFDRGHLCPSADRDRNKADNSATFYLTNMVAQSGRSNRGPWQKLESYARTLVYGGARLFILAGGIYGQQQTIGGGVTVPDSTFKVIIVLKEGEDASSVTEATRVISVIIPNKDSEVDINDDWRKYRVTVRDVEDLTGLDFLTEVAPEIQEAVETRPDAL